MLEAAQARLAALEPKPPALRPSDALQEATAAADSAAATWAAAKTKLPRTEEVARQSARDRDQAHEEAEAAEQAYIEAAKRLSYTQLQVNAGAVCDPTSMLVDHWGAPRRFRTELNWGHYPNLRTQLL